MEVNWKDPAYLQWLKEIWHVEIKEDARHLWPGHWLISGWYQDEKDLYKKYEKEWENKRHEVWEKDAKPPVTLEELASGDLFMQYGEDYFHWNVETPSWSMHRNGTWNKMLVSPDEWLGNARNKIPNDRSEYPGIFNSYEHACKTLGNCNLQAPRFAIGELTDYEGHLKDFVNNYDYTK
jgi:hypothetical protein